jgi:hypothetical protein
MTAKTRIIFKRFVIGINLLLSSCLLLLHILSYINQADFWFVNLFALALPFLLLAQLCFFLIWMGLKSRWKWVSVITVLLSWKFILVFFAFHLNAPGKNKAVSNTALRITTWNVHLFNIPFYKTSLDSSMVTKIKELNPAVLSIQEMMYAKDLRSPLSLDSIRFTLGYQYSAAGFEDEQYKTYKSLFTYCGVIFSKYPILSVKTVIMVIFCMQTSKY